MPPLYFVTPFVLQKLVIPPLKIIFKFFLHWEIEGLENLNLSKGKGIIFELNHSSELDSMMLPVALPFFSLLSPMFYVALPQEAYGWRGWRQFVYTNFFFKAWGAFPAYRKKHVYKEKLKHHIKILNDGFSLCIFPEGIRSRDGKIGPSIGGGIAYLAHTTKADIVAVFIEGTFSINPKKFFTRKGKVRIKFGDSFMWETKVDEKRQFLKGSQEIFNKVKSLQ
jgi:1-acyl-sn-glycerol-3-phosphate acyltransferase